MQPSFHCYPMSSIMSKITVFITERSKSSRLPKKCHLNFGEVSVIEHVVLRALHYEFHPIICTTTDPSDDEIQILSDQLKVKCFRGPTNNKLLRWLKCCQEHDIEFFHSVDADDPFFCPIEVERSVGLLLKHNLDMVEPSPSSARGGATVGYSLRKKIIYEACSMISPESDTEMMWSFIHQVQSLKSMTLSDPVENVIIQRMTLDYWEDYIFLESLRSILGNLASRKEIFDLLQNNPDLPRINSFRNDEWAKNQKNKSYNR